MAQEEHKDSDLLQPKRKLQAKRKPQPPPPKTGRALAGANTQQAAGKHSIRACTVSDDTTLLFCSTCGAFKWKRTSKLGASCPQHLLGPGAKQRLNMIKAGRFPNSSLHMTIGPHRTPSMEELSTIRVAQLALDPASNRADILEAYGQTEESIKAHIARIAAEDARRTPTLASA